MAAKSQPPSQRYLNVAEPETILLVNESMQNFVYKKMSKMIEDSVEFVDVKSSKSKKRKSEAVPVIKLLKDTEPINLEAGEYEYPAPKQVKPTICRREIEPDALNDVEKIQVATISADQVTKSTAAWRDHTKKDKNLFKYKEKKSSLYFIEPENEFSKMRKKNNWSESKIRNYKLKHEKLKTKIKHWKFTIYS